MKARLIITLLGGFTLWVAGCNQAPGGLVSYEGSVLNVIQTESDIVVGNISDNPVTIRVSWDNMDPYGTGEGEDSFIDEWVEPDEWINLTFKAHTSVQVWAWGASGALVDSCDVAILPQQGEP